MEEAGEPAERRGCLLEGLGDLYFLSSLEAHPATTTSRTPASIAIYAKRERYIGPAAHSGQIRHGSISCMAHLTAGDEGATGRKRMP